jgi:hypothetical protein
MIGRFSRRLRPYLLLGLGLARTISYGAKNARRDPARSVWLAHKAVNDPTDLARFIARLAVRYMSVGPGSRESLDIVLLADRDAPLSDYMFLPYLWTSAFNVHVVNDQPELDAMLPTLAAPATVAQLRSDLAQSRSPVAVEHNVIGKMRLPALFMNRARELMKVHDWSAYYCAISIDAGIPPARWLVAFHELATTHPAWCFLLLGTNDLVDDYSTTLPPNVVAPGRSGATFLSQLAIAMQADAFMGPLDVFGAASVMAGVDTALLNDNGAELVIKFVNAGAKMRYVPTGASIADELKLLLTEHTASIQLAIEQAAERAASA